MDLKLLYFHYFYSLIFSILGSVGHIQIIFVILAGVISDQVCIKLIKFLLCVKIEIFRSLPWNI